MTTRNGRDAAGSPLSRRQRILLGGAVVVALAAVAGLAASTLVKSPAQETADQKPPTPSLLSAPVVDKALTSTLVMRATFTVSRRQDFTPTSVAASSHGAAGSSLVVTGVFTKPGDTVRAGRVLLEVDERPVFALRGAFPAYRDMEPGETGKDVAQLQAGLQGLGYTIGDTRGYFGTSTAYALQQFYDHIGYPPPLTTAPPAAAQNPASGTSSGTSGTSPGSGKSTSAAGGSGAKSAGPSTEVYLPMSEVVFLPRLPARVAAVGGGVGSTVAAPLIGFRSGGLSLTADLDAASASLVKPGTTVKIESETTGFTTAATVAGIGKQATNPNVNGGNAYVPLRLTRRSAWPQKEAGDDVRVTITTASTGRAVLAVPEAAISSTAAGQTLVTVLTAAGTQRVVDVTVGVSAGGLVAVTPLHGAQLAAGEKVVTGT